MTYKELSGQIQKKKSYLCVGLDSDINKIPKFLLDYEFPVFEFNKRIINATHSFSVAYKLNTAFYETMGAAGWATMELTVNYIRENYPGLFLIADAKRGDIGNTSSMYATTFLRNMDFDAITVAPYMGTDSVTPFLHHDGKWVILLALTSNEGAADFQLQKTGSAGKMLYEHVIQQSASWGDYNNMMYVVGATRADAFKNIRKIIPNHFLLVPGVGAQGGSLKDVSSYGLNRDAGLLINASRSIIYADGSDRFDKASAREAEKLQQEMSLILKARRIIN